MAGKKKVKSGRLTVVNADCAGVDIGKSYHYVAVDPERFENPVRKFGSFTSDLGALAQWLSACGVKQVAMESTSVYWIPMFEVLDRAGFDVMLVPPRMTKQISGRKSDVLDCQWIRQLLSYGLLRGSYRPDDGLCPLRSLVRQCKRLTEDRSRSVLHVQKALSEMNVQLDSVISDIMGVTGQRILRAIVDGERDPQVLAAMRDRRTKSSASTIASSLEGTWREEHLFALKQALERYDFFAAQVAACEAQILAALKTLSPPEAPDDGGRGCAAKPPGKSQKPKHTLHTSLQRMMGVDLTAIPTIGPETALVIASEIGPTVSAFPTMQQFCSWLGLAPGTRISGDRRLRSKGRTAGQSRWAGVANGGDVSAAQPELYRRETSFATGAHGYAGGDQSNRTRAGAHGLPDAVARSVFRRTRDRVLRGRTPDSAGQTSASQGQGTRLQPD